MGEDMASRTPEELRAAAAAAAAADAGPSGELLTATLRAEAQLWAVETRRAAVMRRHDLVLASVSELEKRWAELVQRQPAAAGSPAAALPGRWASLLRREAGSFEQFRRLGRIWRARHSALRVLLGAVPESIRPDELGVAHGLIKQRLEPQQGFAVSLARLADEKLEGALEEAPSTDAEAEAESLRRALAQVGARCDEAEEALKAALEGREAASRQAEDAERRRGIAEGELEALRRRTEGLPSKEQFEAFRAEASKDALRCDELEASLRTAAKRAEQLGEQLAKEREAAEDSAVRERARLEKLTKEVEALHERLRAKP